MRKDCILKSNSHIFWASSYTALICSTYNYNKNIEIKNSEIAFSFFKASLKINLQKYEF